MQFCLPDGRGGLAIGLSQQGIADDFCFRRPVGVVDADLQLQQGLTSALDPDVLRVQPLQPLLADLILGLDRSRGQGALRRVALQRL